MNSELSFSFSAERKLIQPKFTKKLQHSTVLTPTVFEGSSNAQRTGLNGQICQFVFEAGADEKYSIARDLTIFLIPSTRTLRSLPREFDRRCVFAKGSKDRRSGFFLSVSVTKKQKYLWLG
jgi:hypothetical protein